MNRYKKKSGSATTDGPLYEVKVAMFLFMKGINSGKPFKLATNMDACGKFDDVIFQCQVGNEMLTYLIQLKYKKKKAVLMESLKSTTGEMSLFQYLGSYRNMIANYPTSDELKTVGKLNSFRFVLYMNAEISKQVKYIIDVDSILNSEGKVISFQDKDDDEVYNIFKDYKFFRTFLNDVLKLPVSDKRQNIDQMHQDLKSKVKTKEIQLKLKEPYHFYDESTVQKLKQDTPDPSEFEEFLKNFRVYSSQANIKKFDSKIKTEIEIACNTSLTITDKMHYELKTHITKWWEKTGEMCFLTESSIFWKNMVNNRIYEIELLSKPMVDKLSNMNIHFEESEVTMLKEKIVDTQALQVVIPETMAVLSILKVLQAIQGECFISTNLNILLKEEINFLSSWKTKWYKYLIIEDIETSDNVKNLADKIINILQNDVTKKFILIGPRKSALSSHLNILSSFSDEYNLTSLTPDSQHLLLNKFIHFQGYKIPFNSLIDQDKNLVKIVRNDFLCKLTSSEEEHIQVGDDIKKGIDYYIQRTLNHYDQVNVMEIERMISDSTLNVAVSGVNKSDLSKEAQNASNCIVFDFTQRRFEEMSIKYENIHWFHRQLPERFVWKESKGSIENVYEYLDNRNWSFHEPKTLLDIEDRVVLIVAPPGMGKSTLVTHLALETKQRESEDTSSHQSTWIAQVNLNDYTNILEKISENKLNIHFIVNFLQEEVLKLRSDIEKQLFEYSLKRKGNVVIIFDAYDEISPDYTEKVSIILKELQKVNKGKLWVTSRCKDREKLERDLSTLAFSLQAFRETEQHKFLHEVWKSKFPTIDKDILKEFIKDLLDLIAKSLSDKERKFTGVPLQTMMLAEVFEDNARECGETHKENLPPAIDLLELYDKFVEKKLHIFWTEKSKFDLSNPGTQYICENIKENLMEGHKNCALISLIPAKVLASLKGFKEPIKFLTAVKNGKEKSGIIEGIKDGKPQFIHQTLSEYFSAIWFSENFKQNESFLTTYIFSSRYDVLKNIFDRVLAKDKELHKAVLNNNRNAVQQLLQAGNDVNDLDGGGRTALHLAVSLGKCSQINKESFNYSAFLYAYTENVTDEDLMVQLLLENNADVSKQDEVLGWTPLQYADKSGSSFTILGLLLEYNANPKELKDTKKKLENYEQAFIEGTFVMAIEHNFVSLICYMIQNGIPLDQKLPCDNCRVTKGYTTIFHKSVLSEKLNIASKLFEMGANVDILESNNNTALHLASRDGRIEAVKFLVSLKCNIEPQNSEGDTPLHLAARSGNLDIVQYLVESGANTAILNDAKYSALHMAAYQDDLELVRFLYKHDGKRFFEIEKCSSAVTPLHLAVKRGKLNNVKYLVQEDIDVDVCDDDGNTALHYTDIPHYQSRNPNSDLIQCLVEAGANLNKQNKNGETVIFWASENGVSDLFLYLFDKGIDLSVKNKNDNTLLMHAIKNNKRDVVDYLLNTNKIDISACNEDGNNALHLAAEKGNVEMASLLHDRDRKLNIRNKNGYTPLLYAAAHGNWDFVKSLRKKGLTLHGKNEDGMTALHMASMQGNTAIVKWLVRNGFKLNHKTIKGESTLHFAVKNGNIDLREYISKQTNFNVTNNLGDSTMYLASQTNHAEVIEYLIQNGVEVNVKNNKGLTPLHEAVNRGIDCVNILLNNGADVHAKDVKRRTPLHIASMSANMDFNVMRILIYKGANVNASDKLGKTALHLALETIKDECKLKRNVIEKIDKIVILLAKNANQGNLDAAMLYASLTGLWSVMPCLVENNANVNVYDSKGFTPLHRVAYKGEVDVVNYLLDKNANIHAETKRYGITPLHFAAFNGHFDTVRMLLRVCNYNPWVVNKKDSFGNTALHCAAVSGNSTLVNYLIRKRANIASVNKKGKTALNLAQEQQMYHQTHISRESSSRDTYDQNSEKLL